MIQFADTRTFITQLRHASAIATQDGRVYGWQVRRYFTVISQQRLN
ncbi:MULTISPECIES: hypothetical protein [Pseudomonas syringae group]|nr:hypothetical protein [Pseudomonas syringae group genomosp. 3]